MFDGEPCLSQGFGIGYCKPFKIGMETNNTAILDIRYQPDFTTAFIRKSLTLVTNIGDLEYIIEVRIPFHMLSKCHDSLPRPPLENYLFYLGFILFSTLILVMLISSLFESNTILRYQTDKRKQIYSMVNEEKQFYNVHDFVSEYQMQRENQTHLLNTNTTNSNSTTLTNSLTCNTNCATPLYGNGSSGVKSRTKSSSSTMFDTASLVGSTAKNKSQQVINSNRNASKSASSPRSTTTDNISPSKKSSTVATNKKSKDNTDTSTTITPTGSPKPNKNKNNQPVVINSKPSTPPASHSPGLEAQTQPVPTKTVTFAKTVVAPSATPAESNNKTLKSKNNQSKATPAPQPIKVSKQGVHQSNPSPQITTTNNSNNSTPTTSTSPSVSPSASISNSTSTSVSPVQF